MLCLWHTIIIYTLYVWIYLHTILNISCKCKCCCFMATFVQNAGQVGGATSKSNEAKKMMKPLSDIAQPGLEPRCYRYVANCSTSYAMEAPRNIPCNGVLNTSSKFKQFEQRYYLSQGWKFELNLMIKKLKIKMFIYMPYICVYIYIYIYIYISCDVGPSCYCTLLIFFIQT